MSVTKDGGFPVSSHNVAQGTGTTTWPSFTCSSGRFIVAMMLGNGSAANVINSFTSPNLTWTNKVQVIDAGNNYRVEIWVAWAAAAVTSEVISTTHDTTGGPNYGYRDFIIWSFNGTDSLSAGNTGSSNTLASGADPSLAITATAAGSYIVVGLPYRSGGSDIAVDSNSTSEYDEGGGGSFGFTSRAASRTSSGAGSLTTGFTGTPFTSASIGGIEIKTGVVPTDSNIKNKITHRPAPFKPMGDGFRTAKYGGFR